MKLNFKSVQNIHFTKKTIKIIILSIIIVASFSYDISFIMHMKRVGKGIVYIKPISSKEIVHGNTSKKQIIFTFDAGSGTQSADKILGVLAKHHVKGTFFVTGKFIEGNKDLIMKVVSSGHEVFNHTYDHPHLTSLKDSDIVAELNKADTLLKLVTGSSTKPFFRAPYGDRDTRVEKVAAKAGYYSVYWTVDARDWQQSEGATSAEVSDLILSSLKCGNIYLMHVGDDITGEILDNVFTKIEEKGFKIVSLTEGL